MSKANRKRGVKREKYRFICDIHDEPFRGPVRFSHEEARKDWAHHNVYVHDGVKSRMDNPETISLLTQQHIISGA